MKQGEGKRDKYISCFFLLYLLYRCFLTCEQRTRYSDCLPLATGDNVGNDIGRVVMALRTLDVHAPPCTLDMSSAVSRYVHNYI